MSGSWQKPNFEKGEDGRRGKKRPANNDDPFDDDSTAAKIMKLMGYRKGTGIGKLNQGISEPIKVEQRRHKYGIGFESNIIETDDPIPHNLEWNINEEVNIDETVEWIPSLYEEIPDLETLKTWLKVGEKKEIIDDETNFVDPDILKWILNCKNALDHMNYSDLFHARKKSNPYEAISKGIFQNRAAMKMANMDCILGFEITQPKFMDEEIMVKEQELLYFADICAGPGGFSEYILWRKKWKAKGFGFTLKNEDNDFKLDDFISGRPESFEPHYGAKGNGDIYDPENCKAFMDYVLEQSKGLGVHFVMADGISFITNRQGFSVKGKENIQEVLSRQLYLSQAYVALGIIRKGGHFICKLFDVFTPFSVGLVYIMRFCFENVSLLKPITSRPANSERYLIGKWRKANVTPVLGYLRDCHAQMWDWSCNKQNKDILEIVPLEILKCGGNDDQFLQYIKRHNDENGIKQVQNLRKFVEFHFKPSLHEPRQWEIKNQCLERWGFHLGEVRRGRDIANPEDKFRIILNKVRCQYGGFEKTIDKDFLHTSMSRAGECRSPYNWKICVVENGMHKKNRGFFLSAGRSRIYQFNGNQWELLKHFQKFEMTEDTLVYGEIVTEYFGDVPNQRSQTTFHIIDGLILGGTDIRTLSLEERNNWCQLFAKAMNKTFTVSGLGSFRAKELIPLENFKRSLLPALQEKIIKGRGKGNHLLCSVSFTLDDDNVQHMPFIEGGGVLFLQDIQDPWLKCFSRTHNTMYYWNKLNNSKDFLLPSEANSDFICTMSNRMFWKWDRDVDLFFIEEIEEAEPRVANKIHSNTIIQWLNDIKTNGVK